MHGATFAPSGSHKKRSSEMSIANIQQNTQPWEQVQQSAPKIYKAIIAAKKEVGVIGKNAATDQRGGAKYDYRKFDDVINVVAPLMDRHGLMIIPQIISKEERQDGSKHFVTLTMEFRLFAEDGSFVVGSQVGEAFDVGDKAATKAQTVALRIFYCTVFNIAYEEMRDPEDGDQHQWSNRNKNAYQGMVAALSSLQEPSKLDTFLKWAFLVHNTPNSKGDVITTDELMQLEKEFTAAARRLRVSEPDVQKIITAIQAKVSGVAPQTKAPDITVEPVKIRELKLDFGTAKRDELDRLVMTAVQSFRSGHITRGELSELCGESCPEDASRGPACFFLGAVERCGSAAELSQTVADITSSVQQKQLHPDVGRSLTNLAQTLIDSGSKSNGDE